MTALSITDRLTPREPVAFDAPPCVAAAGVAVRLGDRVILREIDLSLPAGRMIVILGANGAGKSTLLSTLATLTPIAQGTLHLFGQDVSRDGATLRARIGMIGHQPMLYRDLTARENLKFFGDLYQIASAAGRAEQLLERVGLLDRADDPVKTFSRGMTQRVAIARALMHEPDLLLADEPFSGLDLASSEKLEAMLGELRDEGKAIVVAHHDIHHALRFADDVAVLRRGRLALCDRAQHLTAESLRREVLG